MKLLLISKFKKFVKNASESGALILYDPNFRSSHISELNELRPLIIENIGMANLLRGSDEDFKNIFGVNTPDEAWETIREYCGCLVYTANVEGVYVRTASFKGRFPVENITPLSTIGAGDNFNAGMISSIYRNNIKREELESLTEREWSEIISAAVSFATHVCMSYDNYISDEFAEKFRKEVS